MLRWRLTGRGPAPPPFGSVTAVEHASAVGLLVETSKHVFVIRQMAAAPLQLACFATGRLDAYVETGDDVYDWLDVCSCRRLAARLAR